MILVYIVLLILSFFLLAIISEDFFVKSLDIISHKLKLPSDVAGATLMAVGSSAPEFFTAFIAVFRSGLENIGAGTIVGSAIFNILVIIGAAASFRQAKLTWQPVVRDLVFYALTICLLLWAFIDGKIILTEALTFLAMYVVYIVAVVNWKKILPYKDIDPMDIIENDEEKYKLTEWLKSTLSYIIPDPSKKPHMYLVTFLLSIGLIGGLSFVLVESAVHIGHILHINPTIIALTVLAGGTSIPDLLSSICVAKQGRGDMAVSNATGSNIFDILFSLGLPWTIVLLYRGGSVPVATENLLGSVFLLFATVLAILFILIVRKWTIGRRAGLFLIALYILYVVYNIYLVL